MKSGLQLGSVCIISVVFGLYAVKHIPIPLFGAVRRCAILGTIIVQYLIENKLPDSKLSITTFILLLGAIIAGHDSLDANALGYALVWGNNLAQSFQNVLVSKFNADGKITPFEINFFFALIGLPITLFLTVMLGEFGKLFEVFFDPDTRGLALCVLMSGCFGILITITTVLVSAVCGPVANNVSGTLKDIGLTYAGFVFFDDIKVTKSVLAGLGLSFAGAVFLAWNRVKEH